MKSLTYLVYIIFWESLTIGGTGYVVFGLGHSGWWFVLGIFLSAMGTISPAGWIHGKFRTSDRVCQIACKRCGYMNRQKSNSQTT